jgi:hypothetical protein
MSHFDDTRAEIREAEFPPIRQGMRAAAYLILTPFFLFLGWSTLAGALVAATGLADATTDHVAYLMISVGTGLGWLRYRHR